MLSLGEVKIDKIKWLSQMIYKPDKITVQQKSSKILLSHSWAKYLDQNVVRVMPYSKLCSCTNDVYQLDNYLLSLY